MSIKQKRKNYKICKWKKNNDNKEIRKKEYDNEYKVLNFR